jgi:hypothetical protein
MCKIKTLPGQAGTRNKNSKFESRKSKQIRKPKIETDSKSENRNPKTETCLTAGRRH